MTILGADQNRRARAATAKLAINIAGGQTISSTFGNAPAPAITAFSSR